MNFDWADREKLEAVCNSSLSATEILRKLGYRKGGYSYKTLKKYAELYEIKLPSETLNTKFPEHRPTSEILVENSTFNNGGWLKARLLKESLLDEKCYDVTCPVKGPVWNNKPLTLQLEHINGIPTDNRIENLILLCPNCHTQTDTWGRKNRVNMVPGVGKRDAIL